MFISINTLILKPIALNNKNVMEKQHDVILRSVFLNENYILKYLKKKKENILAFFKKQTKKNYAKFNLNS